MAKNNNIGDLLQSVANAIRTRKGTTEPINAQNFDQEILDIPSGMNSIDETADVIKACGGEVSYDDSVLANGVAKLFADEPTENTWNGARVTADGGSIRDGVAYVSKVNGKTLKVWQIVKRSVSARTVNGISISYEDDSTIVLNGTATVDTVFYGMKSYGGVFALTELGNKLLSRIFYIGNRPNGSYRFGFNSGVIANNTPDYLIYTNSGNYQYPLIQVNKDCVCDNVKFKWNVFDLTKMFGSGNEPITPNEFAQRLGYATIDDVPYIPYTETPQLVSLTASGVKSKEKTIMWNQLYELKSTSLSTSTTMLYKQNGVFNLKGNDTRGYGYFQAKVAIPNHKYFFYFKVISFNDNRSNQTINVRFTGNGTIVSSKQYTINSNYSIQTAPLNSDNIQTQILYSSNADIDTTLYIRLHDLTDMFGEGNEPSAEEFLAMFPNDYYETNTGEELNYNLKSPMVSTLPLPIDQIIDEKGEKVFPNGLLSVGDIHDEIDLERGVAVKRVGVYIFTGNELSDYFDVGDKINTITYTGVDKWRDMIIMTPVIICNHYNYFGNVTTKANANAIGVEGILGYSSNNTSRFIYINTTKTSASEFKTYLQELYTAGRPLTISYPIGTPVEYPLYTANTKCLTAGSVSDEIDLENGTFTKKIGVVDLGTLQWSVVGTLGVFKSTAISSMAIPKSGVINFQVVGYDSRIPSYNESYANYDKVIWCYSGSNTLRLRDSSYTDAADLKKALSGTLLYYELATPQTYPLLPTQRYYKVQANGTEQLMRKSRNLWDEEMEVGAYATATGNAQADNTKVRSKNFIPIDESLRYYLYYPIAGRMIATFYYDKDKNYIGYKDGTKAQSSFVPLAGAAYMKFWVVKADDNTLCLNVSDDSFNGQYEPYGDLPYDSAAPLTADIGYRGSIEAEALNLL